MRRKIIWTLLLLIGAAGSLVACQDTVDYIETTDWSFRNMTSHSVEIIGYESPTVQPVGAPVEVTERIWQIAPGKTLEIRSQFSIVRDPAPVPLTCDSVRVVFDGLKELKCYAEYLDMPENPEGDICRTKNYLWEGLGEHHRHFTYEITPAQYDAATPIAGAEQ